MQSLISQNPDIQKILAFEGAFEKLFNIIIAEGGVDGGAAVRDALTCVDGLLRFNQSNQVIFISIPEIEDLICKYDAQSYLRNSTLPPILLSLLAFPSQLPVNASAPQAFSLQLWDMPQKRANSALVIGILGVLAKGTGMTVRSGPEIRRLHRDAEIVVHSRRIL